MKVLALDTEATTSNYGNPYDETNELVCFSWASDEGSGVGDRIEHLHDLVSGFDSVVLFNSKYDLAWFRRVGVPLQQRIWDIQLGAYILSDQRWRYPSLEGVADKYLGEHKLDVVKTEYWDKGIDTKDIPKDILYKYAEQDAILTYKLWLKVSQLLKERNQWQLFSLQCQDIPILFEMEWNGMKWDRQGADQRRLELQKERDQLVEKLNAIYPDLRINFNSTDQLSAFLYGGTIKEVVKEHVGFFKTGAKIGQPKYQNKEIIHELPRLFTPLPDSQMAKEGVFSTSEDTLLKLKGKRKTIIQDLLALAKLDKLLSGYFEGFPKLIDSMHWKDDIIHGTLNQVVAQTGRLSATKPNQQNLAPDAARFIVTRY